MCFLFDKASKNLNFTPVEKADEKRSPYAETHTRKIFTGIPG